jgi:hypothetical protein
MMDQSTRRSGQALLVAGVQYIYSLLFLLQADYLHALTPPALVNQVSLLMQTWETGAGTCRYSTRHVPEYEAHLPNPFSCGTSRNGVGRAMTWAACPLNGRRGLQVCVAALLQTMEEPALTPGLENSWLHMVL